MDDEKVMINFVRILSSHMKNLKTEDWKLYIGSSIGLQDIILMSHATDVSLHKMQT